MTAAHARPRATQRQRALLWIAVGANLAVTLPLARALNIWQDEAYTLHTTSRTLGYAFTQAIGFEQNAPLYFLAIALWRHAGDSPFFLRLFSVLCVAGAIALVPALARRYVPSVNPLYVTAVVACNPFVVWAAVEIRVYAAIVLLSALLLLFFFDAFLDARPRPWTVVAYAGCVILALYTQYYFAFLFAAQAVTLLAYQRRAIVRFGAACVAAALVFAPMLVIVPGQVANFRGGFAPPSLLHTFGGLSGIMLRYVVPLRFTHATPIAGALLLVGAIVWIAFTRPALRTVARPIVVMTAGAFALFTLGTYAGGVHVLERHAASLYLPVTLAVFGIFGGFGAGRSPERARFVAAWTCAVLACSVLTLGLTYRTLAKPGDWERAAAYLRANVHDGEPIAVFEAENALPLAYYYRGPSRIVAIPKAVDFDRYDVTDFVIGDDRQLAATMPAAGRLWLVTAGECSSSNLQFGCNRLERFVAQRYRVQSDASFYGSRIRRLELLRVPKGLAPPRPGRAR